MRQRCKMCSRADHFDFSVPDKVWEKVTEDRYNVLCLACFDYLASAKGINYAEDIYPEIYFAGDAGSFTLRITSRSEATMTHCVSR